MFRQHQCFGQIAKNFLFNYISFISSVMSTYVLTCERVLEEDISFLKDFNKQLILEIKSEIHSNCEKAKNYMKEYLNFSFPEINKDIQIKHIATNIIQA